jgi:hypothetical protein
MVNRLIKKTLLLVGLGSVACSEPCTNLVQGVWLDTETFCPTSEQITSCSSHGANEAATCYVYIPTGQIAIVNQQQPPTRASGFDGPWRLCTDQENGEAFNTSNVCSDANGDSGID